jgi:hypothetical protein
MDNPMMMRGMYGGGRRAMKYQNLALNQLAQQEDKARLNYEVKHPLDQVWPGHSETEEHLRERELTQPDNYETMAGGRSLDEMANRQRQERLIEDNRRYQAGQNTLKNLPQQKYDAAMAGLLAGDPKPFNEWRGSLSSAGATSYDRMGQPVYGSNGGVRITQENGHPLITNEPEPNTGTPGASSQPGALRYAGGKYQFGENSPAYAPDELINRFSGFNPSGKGLAGVSSTPPQNLISHVLKDANGNETMHFYNPQTAAEVLPGGGKQSTFDLSRYNFKDPAHIQELVGHYSQMSPEQQSQFGQTIRSYPDLHIAFAKELENQQRNSGGLARAGQTPQYNTSFSGRLPAVGTGPSPNALINHSEPMPELNALGHSKGPVFLQPETWNTLDRVGNNLGFTPDQADLTRGGEFNPVVGKLPRIGTEPSPDALINSPGSSNPVGKLSKIGTEPSPNALNNSPGSSNPVSSSTLALPNVSAGTAQAPPGLQSSLPPEIRSNSSNVFGTLRNLESPPAVKINNFGGLKSAGNDYAVP